MHRLVSTKSALFFEKLKKLLKTLTVLAVLFSMVGEKLFDVSLGLFLVVCSFSLERNDSEQLCNVNNDIKP